MIEYCTRSVYNSFELLDCEIDWREWAGMNLNFKEMNFIINGVLSAWVYRIDNKVYEEITTEFSIAWDKNIMWMKLQNA